MSSPSRPVARIVWLAGASAAGYLCLALLGDLKESAGAFLSIHAILFVIYLGAVRWTLHEAPRPEPGATGVPVAASGPGAAPILWAALAFRLIVMPSAPTLSDDIYRYIWEGRLQLHGINPYLHAPSDPELAPWRDAVYEGINNKDLPAIYPPVMQWVFAIGALIGATTTGMKALFIGADMAMLVLLATLLRESGLPGHRVLICAWNPLAVVEVAGSGHNDTLAVCFLMASTLGIIRERRVLSMTALAGSALCKLFPAALLPLFARRVRPAHLLIPPALIAACYLPYAGAGVNLVRSVREYAERWRSNDSIFTGIVAAVQVSGVSDPAKRWADAHALPSLYTQPHMIARGLAALAAAGVMIALLFRLRRGSLDLPRAVYLFTGSVLLLSPTLHPWYLLWIIPWLALHPSPAWLALTGLIPLFYLDAGWVRWAEYVPFYALLACGSLGPAARSRLAAPVLMWRPTRRRGP